MAKAAELAHAFEIVEASAKKYELISTKLDPQYDLVVKAVPLVKNFIAERGLIIYGGTAIDYALRLHGSCIYPDEQLAIPDLDMYSKDSVSAAYDLADILFAAGYKDVRVIRATYVRTMRVDIGDNHF